MWHTPSVDDGRRYTFLADRTNGRAYATVLRLSVCLSSVTLCIVAKRCVLEQKLLLTAYIGSRMWGIHWYQIEWPWPLFRGCLRSCQSLHHIRHWISRKPLEIRDRGLVPIEPPIGNGIPGIEWSQPMTSLDPKDQVVIPIRLEANISITSGDAI